MPRVVYARRIPVPAEALFQFRQNPWNVARMSSRFPRIDIHAPSRPAEAGDEQILHARLWRRRYAMRMRIDEVSPPRRVVDIQIDGPFRFWRHQHVVLPRDDQESVLVDIVDFRYFGGPAGRLLDTVVVKPLLWVYFSQQHRRLRAHLGRHTSWRRRLPLGR